MTSEPKPRYSWTERLPGWARGRVQRIVGSDFAHKVGETMVTRLALIAIGLVTSVLIARALGPEGRGLQAAIAALTAVGVQIGNLGLHSSNTYYVAKKHDLLPNLVGNSLLVSLVLATAVGLFAGAVLTVWPQLSPVDGVYLWLALAGIPLGLSYLLLQNLLMGVQEVRAYNLIELGVRLLMVAVLSVLIFADAVSVTAIALAGLATTLMASVWSIARLRPLMRERISVSPATLKRHLGYGFRAYVAAAFAFTVIKADVLLCSYILGDGPTGQYSIAASMAEMVYMLPVVAGTIAFPRLTATADRVERWAKAKSMTKWVALMLAGLVVAAALFAEPVVLLLYGEAFLPSVEAFLWLLPGVFALGVNTILMNYFASEGMPSVAIWSPATASVVNIGLNIWLLPVLGITGASVASTVAYGMMLAMSAGYIHWRGPRGVATQ